MQFLVPAYAEKADIEFRVTPHIFRRSCATELIKGNANLSCHVKDILGHESLDTLIAYVKLDIRDLKKTLLDCCPREK